MEKVNVGGATSTPSKTTKATTAPGQASMQSMLNSVDEAFARLPKSSQMTEKAKAHLDSLLEKIAGMGCKVVFSRMPFGNAECVFLGSETTKIGVILVYSDFTGGSPLLSNIGDILVAFSPQTKGYKIEQTIAIVENDYTKIEILAANLYAYLEIPRAAITTNVMGWKESIVIATNRPNIVREAMNAMSPHTILPRCDFGYALFKSNRMFNSASEIDYNKLQPISVLPAYNRFAPVMDNNVLKYTPVVTISEIMYKLPDPGLLALAMSIAIDGFIKKGVWKTPYMSNDPNQVNLCRMFLDPATGKMMAPSTDQNVANTERDAIFRNLLMAPHIGFDYVEGRFRLPDLEKFDPSLGMEALQTITQYFSKFCNRELPLSPSAKGVLSADPCGYIMRGDQSSDSREIDYNSLAVTIHQPEILERFKWNGSDPDWLSQNYSTYRQVFGRKTIVIEPAWFEQVFAIIGQTMKVQWDNVGMTTPSTSTMAVSMFGGQNTFGAFGGESLGSSIGNQLGTTIRTPMF